MRAPADGRPLAAIPTHKAILPVDISDCCSHVLYWTSTPLDVSGAIDQHHFAAVCLRIPIMHCNPARAHCNHSLTCLLQQDVRKQLVGIMDRYKMDIVTAGRNYNKVCVN